MKKLLPIVAVILAAPAASAGAQAFTTATMGVAAQCGADGTLFDWQLQYEPTASEVVCLAASCDTSAWIDVWDYNPGGTDSLLCSLRVLVTADWDGDGLCFTPSIYGQGSFICDLDSWYGGAEGSELELYFVMEVDIPNTCANPYFSSPTHDLPQCSGGPNPPPGSASINCSGTSCSSAPNPLGDNQTATFTFDPCGGGGFSWSADGSFESGNDRACVGGGASAGSSGGCSAGTELTGSGPWSGMESGPVVLSLATDNSVASTGLTSFSASCGAPPPPVMASIRCSGVSCASSPIPLPHDATAAADWTPCSGMGFTWSAEGSFEAGIDRACLGGQASSGTAGGCAGGIELSGTGPWSGTASAGTMHLSLATDSSVESAGLMRITASCPTAPPPPPPPPPPAQKPDLSLEGVRMPTSMPAGETLLVELTVRNAGSTPSPATEVQILLSEDTALGGDDVLLCVDMIPELAPGRAQRDAPECALPMLTEPGAWHVLVMADATGALSEADESNNFSVSRLVVDPPRAKGGAQTTADSSGCSTGGRGALEPWWVLGLLSCALAMRGRRPGSTAGRGSR